MVLQPAPDRRAKTMIGLTAMPSDARPVHRFRSRREAEKVVSEIVGDGGRANEYRIDQDTDGTCVILILDTDTNEVAGVLGA
jgi:hypothetical protein